MKTKKLIFAALFAALTCVATMIIKVPHTYLLQRQMQTVLLQR